MVFIEAQADLRDAANKLRAHFTAALMNVSLPKGRNIKFSDLYGGKGNKPESAEERAEKIRAARVAKQRFLDRGLNKIPRRSTQQKPQKG